MAPTVVAAQGISYQDVQEDEIQALQAIYYDGFEEVTANSGPWKTASDHAFTLILRSRIDMETTVKLSVRMTATYPNTAPILKVEDADSLKPKFQGEIEKVLKDKPKCLLGNEMIHEIAQAIEDILDHAVQHVEMIELAPTLEEERELNENMAKEAELDRQRTQEQELLAAQATEKRLVGEKLAKTLKLRQGKRRKSAHFFDSHDPSFAPDFETTTQSKSKTKPLLRTESTSLTETAEEEMPPIPPIDFDEPWALFQGQSGRKKYVFKAIVDPQDPDEAALPSGRGPVTDTWPTRPTGLPCGDAAVMLKAVYLRKTDSHESVFSEGFNETMDRLNSLMTEISKITNEQPNFLPLLKFKIFYDESFEDHRKIRVVYPLVPHGSLHDQFLTKGFVIEDVRERIKELLAAVELLHSRAIIHGLLHLRNIFILHNGKDGKSLKLADCGFQHELHKLMHPEDRADRQANLEKEGADQVMVGTCPSKAQPSKKTVQKLLFDSRSSWSEEYEVNGKPVDQLLRTPSEGWCAPELGKSKRPVKNSRSDIWDLGVVILQMLFGPEVVRFESPEAALKHFIPTESLATFLKKIFNKDPAKRISPFHLGNDAFLNEKSIKRYGTAPGGEFDFERLIFPAAARVQDEGLPATVSRYSTDFEESARIGKGGFGSVFQAKNKVDGQVYAVKKVRKSEATLYKALSETSLLARLNHPNVVRYFNTWIETAEDKSNEAGESDSDDDSESESTSGSYLPMNGTLMSRPSVMSHMTGAVDHVSSTGGYIEFGFEDDEEGEAEEEVDDDDDESESEEASEANGAASSSNQLSLQKSNETTSPRPQKRVLYIQMEFCEKRTLKDLIGAGLYKRHGEIWSLLRSIVEGLSHIHSNGIIHRDLKPENVFIEATGIPRIGDFGLATSGQYTVINPTRRLSMHSPNLTRSVGTAKYVAPELRSNISEPYTDKVDMYSLGIMLFEMCTEYTTDYSRALQITSLRQRNHVLPPEFSRGELAKFGAIILELIDHQPRTRPTSRELLKSGKVPLKIEDELIKRLLHMSTDPENVEFPKVVEALFAQPNQAHKDYAWDIEIKSAPANELILQNLVKQTLTNVFQLHGAAETSRPVLIPRSEYYAGEATPLLHADSTMVQLPYDLCLPNARAIAKSTPAVWKTFSFGSVYRNTHKGGAPEPSLELDFDIMAPNTQYAAMEEAETIKVMDQILDAFPSLKTHPAAFHINHGVIVELIMDFIRVPAGQRRSVIETVSKANYTAQNWAQARKLLAAPPLGLSSWAIDQLSRFNIVEEPAKAMKKIKSLLGSKSPDPDSAAKLSEVFEHIEEVQFFLKRFGVRRKVQLAPFAAINEKFYTGGFMFVCVFENRRLEVITVGGRYDSLIKALTPNTNVQYDKCHAVGFILGWGKVWQSMIRLQRNQEKKPWAKKAMNELGFWGARRCDVLVASMDSSLLHSTCVDIVTELWAADISAEVARETGSPEQIMAMSRPDNHIWIVIVRQLTGSFQDMFLKVKDMSRKEEFEVRAPELANWLRAELRQRKHKERKLAATEAAEGEAATKGGKTAFGKK
ncbi:MAG: hypothetical protein M1814_003534 [Vezdaea aestivalis]|nr:MAG: hypothetical protein M1814_003534 [Vezdaea aestivalis]